MISSAASNAFRNGRRPVYQERPLNGIGCSTLYHEIQARAMVEPSPVNNDSRSVKEAEFRAATTWTTGADGPLKRLSVDLVENAARMTVLRLGRIDELPNDICITGVMFDEAKMSCGS